MFRRLVVTLLVACALLMAGAGDVFAQGKPPESFTKAYPGPDLAAIDTMLEGIAASAAPCRDALCVKTDCRVTNGLHQNLFLLQGELLADQEWLGKARALVTAHFNQMTSESGRKKAFLDGTITATLNMQVWLTDAAKILSGAADLKGTLEGLSGADTNTVGRFIDVATDELGVIADIVDITDASKQALTGTGVDLPPAFSNTEQLGQTANDIKNIIKAAKELKSMSNAALRAAEISKIRGSVGQILVRVGTIISERQIEDTKQLMEEYKAALKAEGIASDAALAEINRLSALMERVGAMAAKAGRTAQAVGQCLKSCTGALELLRNPPVDFTVKPPTGLEQVKDYQPYLRALEYYQKRVNELRATITDLARKFSASKIAPEDPDAPAICKTIAPDVENDPLAGLTPPVLEFPELPIMPERFCSIQESIAFDRQVLDPIQKRIKEVYDLAARYDTELTLRLLPIKNEINAAEPGASKTPRIIELQRRKAIIDAAVAAFAPDWKRAQDMLSASGDASDAYRKIKVVDNCDGPAPVEITIPEVPDSFCTEEDRAAMLGKLDEQWKAVKAYNQKWRDYVLELINRRAVADKTLAAELTKKLADAREIENQNFNIAVTLQDLIAKAKAAELGHCFDPCLVGKWTVTKYTEASKYFASGGTGARVTFTKDGLETVDYSNMEPVQLTQATEYFVWSGTASAKIKANDGIANLESVVSKGVVMTMHSASAPPEGLPLPFPGLQPVGLGSARNSDAYQCTETTLSYKGTSTGPGKPDNVSVELTREP